MDILTPIVVWLNRVANVLGRFLLAPIGVLPGWLSATVVAAATGVLLLLVFKYTSNQRAIKQVRADIKANLLALRLFKDSAVVALSAQAAIVRGALWLAVYALVPLLVMAVPVLLILGQMALWYQARPLKVGEEAVVTAKLNTSAGSETPEVRLVPTDAVAVTVGPVRIRSKGEVCWNIQARAGGYHQLVFQVSGQSFDKTVAIGDEFMRTELPFSAGDPLRSIEIAYPRRSSWTSGSDWWVYYWFGTSMVAALCFRRALNVNV
jgi:hypothetical protein